MNLQDQLAKLASSKPESVQAKPTLESALAAAHNATASMVAVWSVNEDGQLEYSCFRKEFPVRDLRPAIEQFANDQLAEEFRCRVRDVFQDEGGPQK